jgi:1-acyl-sn-glycerol-3-phosphate acyltransferase
MLKSPEHRVERVDVIGHEHLSTLDGRRDGVLITPNHTDTADGLVMMSVSDGLKRPFCAMAAHQLFAGNAGLRHFLFPRLGIFPVDREGSDLAAIKAAVGLMCEARHPLVVFPEGEIYHTADKLTPLREGVAYMAATAAKRLSDQKPARTVWVVPVGIKYRFVEGYDPVPELLRLMDELEARFTWRPKHELDLVERLYEYAEGMLALKELEYGISRGEGTLPERLSRLRERILGAIESRRLSGRSKNGQATVPERVKEMRRRCLEALGDQDSKAEEASQARRDLHDLFVVIQIYSYPGDYVKAQPSLERIAETLTKCEEDVLGRVTGRPRGPRRAVVRFGEPIDAGRFLEVAGGRPRAAAASLTLEVEKRIQELLDAIGPGRTFVARTGARIETL